MEENDARRKMRMFEGLERRHLRKREKRVLYEPAGLIRSCLWKVVSFMQMESFPICTPSSRMMYITIYQVYKHKSTVCL